MWLLQIEPSRQHCKVQKHVHYLLQCKQTFCSPSKRLWSNIICELPHLRIARSGTVKVRNLLLFSKWQLLYQSSKGKFSDQKLCGSLVFADLSQCYSTRAISEGLACSATQGVLHLIHKTHTILERSRPTYVDHQCAENGLQPLASSLLGSWWVQLSSACP